jgi:hypothetical protein
LKGLSPKSQPPAARDFRKIVGIGSSRATPPTDPFDSERFASRAKHPAKQKRDRTTDAPGQGFPVKTLPAEADTMNAVSRTKRFWLQALAAAFGTAALAGEADAQIGWAPDGEVCTTETSVSGVVTEKKTCVRYRPVTQVCMRRQDCVTYRDECRVGYRQEQYVQCVPKTCYDQVTVDEGCWKMVWCPKPVTKVVPRQTVEKQIACRSVPYTYTQKVPQLVSKWVPEYKTSYVPEAYTSYQQRPFCQKMPSQTTAMMPSCSSPAPSCGAPMIEASCGMPSGGAPHLAPAMPTYAPTVAPATPAGVVPDPTPDPLSYYPTQQHTSTGATPSGSATWNTVKPRRQGPGAGNGASAEGGSSLASLWSRE